MIINPMPKGEYNAPKRVLGIPVRVDIHTRQMAQAHGVWPFKHIVVGENWFYLNKREKMAVLLHEACHCKRLHMEKRLMALPMLIINVGFNVRLTQRQEHEADEFAAKQGYGVELLSALRKFKGKPSIFYPSLDERCNRVGQVMRELQ